MSTPEGEVKTAISNAMVALHRKQFGRGPETTRTVISGDIVTCVLEGVLVASEETLVRRGEARSVLESRGLLQTHAAPDFVKIVEQETGRRVRSFVSGMNAEDGGTATEVFVLTPNEDGMSGATGDPP